MTLPANLFWTHPTGDSTVIPCVHLIQQHPTGDGYVLPCLHFVQQHPNGDPNPVDARLPNVACTHLSAQHPGGHPFTVPCTHLVQQHPKGDPGPTVPCIHPLAPAAADSARHLVFFTNEPIFQSIATEMVDLLRNTLHVRSVGSSARPLLFFFRTPINGNPRDNSDPFWSHYNPVFHTIQVIRDPVGDYSSATSSGYLEVARVLRHELGHAIVGQSCVQVATQGGAHAMTTPSSPGTALSEGWADFVEVLLRRRAMPATPGLMFQPSNKVDFETRDPSVPRTADIEYNVMCLLWDLFDIATTRNVMIAGRPAVQVVADDDAASSPATAFRFEELFGIFSPSLDTLPAGPVIWDIADYLARLRTIYPNRAASIDSVRGLHLV